MMVLWLWLSLAFAGTLSEADDQFVAGDLDAALEVMQPVADGGWGSGKLHYNLANVYYRKGELARSVLHYRYAQRVRPRDGNVHHNLALARSELKGLPEPAGLPSSWMALVTTGELSIVGLLLSLVGTGWIMLWYRREQPGILAMPGVIVLLGGLALCSVATGGVLAVHNHPLAVVVDNDALVRDAPRTDGGERFRLPPGSELSVVSELGQFLLIEDGDGRRGWISVSAAAVAR